MIQAIDIGRRVRALREAQGIKIPTLAKRMGTHRNNLYKLEAGVALPELWLVDKLINTLNVSADYLLFGE